MQVNNKESKMTWPSIILHFRTLRAVTLLVTAALLLPASSYRNANAADPPGGASTSGENKNAPKNERELVGICREMLQVLIRLDPQFREAQAAWKAAEALSAAEKAKDPRSAAANQAYKDASDKWYVQEAIAERRSECYAKLVANRFSLDALYAPPTLSKRFEELAKQIETVLKTRSPTRSLAERDVEIAAQLRDAQTIHTLGQLLVTAEHLRRQGQADAAVRISREADLLESEFKASLQNGRERLKKLVAEEPFAIQFNPQTLQRELKLAEIRKILLDELAATNATLRQVQSDLEATNDALQKATLPAERQHRAQQQAELQAKLQNLTAGRSQRCGMLAFNLRSMDALHAVSKRIEERLAKTLKGRDAETIRTVGRLLVAAENLRRIGKSEAAARISREADLLEKEFTAMLQKGKERSTETLGDSAQPKADGAAAKKVIELRLLDDKQVLVNRRGNIMLEDFKQRLSKALEQYKRQEVKQGDVVVHLWSEEKVACGHLDRLITDCWENGIEHYVLKIEAVYLFARRDKRDEAAPPFNFRFSLDSRMDAPPKDALPPIHIRLRARKDGSLAGIWASDKRFLSIQDLRKWVSGLRREGKPDVRLKVEFNADDDLLFKHLAETVLAVSTTTGVDGPVVLPIEVVPIPRPNAEEQINELETIDSSPRLETKPSHKRESSFSIELDGEVNDYRDEPGVMP
jgi:hypothetical protein